MSTWPQRRATLRWTFPLVLAGVVLCIFMFAHLDSVRAARSYALEAARSNALEDAQRLAKVAARHLQQNPTEVASQLAMLSTQRQLMAVAVIAPQGTVALAGQPSWAGQPALRVIAGFDERLYARALASNEPQVVELQAPLRLAVMVPIASASGAPQQSANGAALVYLEQDLAFDESLARWRAWQRLAPLMLATLVVLALLAWGARRYLTQPMARMEAASLEMADFNRFPAPLAEDGLREVAALARGFNEMSRRIQSAQQALESSRMRLAGVIQAAMDAIITVDATHHIIAINPAALAMFRCTEEQALGQPIHIFIPQRFHASHSAHIRDFVQSGVTRRAMGKVAVVAARRLDGQEFPVEASISHLSLEGGESLLTVILRDVTQRQQAEAAILDLNNGLEALVARRTATLSETTRRMEEQQQVLSAANAELSIIFDTVSVGIVLIQQRVIQRCNRRLEEIFGYARGELDGKPTRPWYPDEQSYEEGGEAAYEELAGHKFHQREQSMVRKDGSRFWCRMTFRPLGDGVGAVMLGVVEDLTLQHEAEQAILRGKQQAEEASRAKSAFLANMSHEIRTPMNAIIGLSYLVLKGELHPRQRGHLEKIQTSSQHLLGIINDILDYSKIEAGKLGLEQIPFRLEDVLTNVSGLIAEKAATKGLEFLIDVDPRLPEVLVGDPLRLGQVLINYANNAVKFTEKGQIGIRLELREQQGRDMVLYGEVSDTGIGLSAQQMEQLFQSFHQSDSSITREFGGTGLGLAICKQLAGLMQGTVGVRSTLGVGSTFWFTARMQAGLAGDAAAAASHWGPSGMGALETGAVAAQLMGGHVLVVEDDELNREVAQEILQGAGLQVDLAMNGQEALACIARTTYDLVLMDMQMPVMDGLTATRTLRADPALAKLPIVAMTANAMAEDRQACMDAGMNDFVSKPIDPAALFSTLRKWMGAGVLAAAPAVAGMDAGQELPSIDGLDCDAGLRRVMGKRRFYLSLLRKFSQRQSGAVVLVRQALRQGDVAAAERQLHTLKGLSASIGMLPLQQAAAQAERLLRERAEESMLDAALDVLHRTLEDFVQQLEQQLPEDMQGFAPDSVDHGEVQSICQRLGNLLAEDDLEAGDVLNENGALLRSAFGAAFDAIDTAVRRFDCEAALAHLRQACAARGYDLSLGAAR